MDFIKRIFLTIVFLFILSNGISAEDKIVKDSIYKKLLSLVIESNYLCDSVNITIPLKRIHIVADEIILSELPETFDSIKIAKHDIRNFREKDIPTTDRYVMIGSAQTNKDQLYIRVQAYKHWEYDIKIKEWYLFRECYFYFKWRRKSLVSKQSVCIECPEPVVLDDGGVIFTE